MKEQRTGGSYYIGSHCVFHWTKNSTIQLHLIIIIIQLIFLRMEPIEKVPKNAQLFNFRIWHFLSLCKGSFSIWCFQSWPTELIYSQLIPFAITHVYQTTRVTTKLLLTTLPQHLFVLFQSILLEPFFDIEMFIVREKLDIIPNANN